MKMYNQLHIHEDHFHYHLILWVPDLEPEGEVEVWVLVHVMYGTVSSGNQAETSIRRGAEWMKITHPLGVDAIQNQTYVDEGIPG
jgi:hypothetical protein